MNIQVNRSYKVTGLKLILGLMSNRMYPMLFYFWLCSPLCREKIPGEKNLSDER